MANIGLSPESKRGGGTSGGRADRARRHAGRGLPGITLREVLSIIRMGCLKCSRPNSGRLLPYPEGRGCMICSHCTPKWQRGYLISMTRRMRAGLLRKEAF